MASTHRIVMMFAALALTTSAGVPLARSQTGEGVTPSGAVEQSLELTATQRSAIYTAVTKDKSKAAPQQFSAVVGADVPPMIELYSLPDDVVAGNPTAKLYEYTVVDGQVVLVDPTKMRVVDVIGPTSR